MPITVEHVDLISIPTQDVARSRQFFADPDGNPLVLHRRYAPAA